MKYFLIIILSLLILSGCGPVEQDVIKSRWPDGSPKLIRTYIIEGSDSLALKDVSFYEKRIQYCRELYTLFPETSDSVIQNMKRAEAESYFALGMQEEGEESFRKLIEEFPDNVWGYIGWGDMYGIFQMNSSIPINYDEA